MPRLSIETGGVPPKGIVPLSKLLNYVTLAVMFYIQPFSAGCYIRVFI